MNDQDIARFEAQAAETVGAMKELFKEFEKRLGEMVSAQRLASSEARNEGVKARAALEELARAARATAEAQRQALTELRGGWQMHVAENSKAAGAEMALTFGEEIAAGLEKRLVDMTAKVEQTTRRLGWMSVLRWGAGIAVGIALTIAIGVWELMPSVDGLTTLQVRVAMTRVVSCHIGQEIHVCVAVDDKLRVGRTPNGTGLAVVSGM